MTATEDVPAADPVVDPVTAETGPIAEAAAETGDHMVEAVAETVTDTAQATATASDDVVAEVSASAHAAADETAKAFESARDRLQKAGFPASDAGADVIERFKSGAEQLSRHLAGDFGRASQAMADFNAKAIAAWRTNAEATIAHWQRLAGMTSWSEIIALNSTHARSQIEALTSQTRELADLAGRMAREGSDALKGSKS